MKFTQKDYNSGDGFNTKIWGPIFWKSLHILSFNYPINPTKKQKKAYKSYILNLRIILPCKKCRDNLISNIKHQPLDDSIFNGREQFSRYIFNLHESVNNMLGKNSGLTYEEVRDYYEQFRWRPKKKNKTLKKHK